MNCPWCAEEIRDEAKVCRYCGRDVLTGHEPSEPGTEKSATWKLLLIGVVVIAALAATTLFIVTRGRSSSSGLGASAATTAIPSPATTADAHAAFCAEVSPMAQALREALAVSKAGTTTSLRRAVTDLGTVTTDLKAIGNQYDAAGDSSTAVAVRRLADTFQQSHNQLQAVLLGRQPSQGSGSIMPSLNGALAAVGHC